MASGSLAGRSVVTDDMLGWPTRMASAAASRALARGDGPVADLQILTGALLLDERAHDFRTLMPWAAEKVWIPSLDVQNKMGGEQGTLPSAVATAGDAAVRSYRIEVLIRRRLAERRIVG